MPVSIAPKRIRPILVGPTVMLIGALLCSSQPAQAQTAASGAPLSTADELAAIKAENTRLRGMLPSQSHSMMDVSFHFTNLWFAGQEKNWPLAQFYLNETISHIKWSIRLVPVRKTKNGPVDLNEKFEPFNNTKLAEIGKQIAAKDRKLFSAAYRDAMSGCNDCHTAAEKPYLLVTVPHHATAEGIDFTPRKDQ